MNNQDKEAFTDWYEDRATRDSFRSEFEDAFEAGIKHERARSQELVEALEAIQKVCSTLTRRRYTCQLCNGHESTLEQFEEDIAEVLKTYRGEE